MLKHITFFPMSIHKVIDLIVLHFNILLKYFLEDLKIVSGEGGLNALSAPLYFFLRHTHIYSQYTYIQYSPLIRTGFAFVLY